MATADSLEPMWEDLRALNASLQRTLDEFRNSFRHASSAGKEMPDARLRLDHVLKLTEDAAHRTLDLVERSGPLADRLAVDALALIDPIRQARDAYSGTSVAELLVRVEDYLSRAHREGNSVRANLAEVLMAQSYQDLSGQIIRTVIKLVAELERTLANFSELAGEGGAQSLAGADSHAANANGYGPAVPGVTAGAVGKQDDVDDLLAGLGM
jgi:chemotaxis protein CheZ